MTTRLRSLALPAVLAGLLLAGCGSSVKLDDGAPVESRSATPVTPGTAAATTPTAPAAGSATAAPQSRVATVDLSRTAPAATAAPLGRVVYFDFDSFAIRDEFGRMIEGHGKALASTAGRRMVVEGHTDERGGREYNLALGQKRAQAVAKALTLVGAKEAQLESVSFGKERPAAEGSDEAAWAKNRRVELKDR
ncbi:MAG: peptidoglycan-associated lipoprotein Pal [Aquabacterium sp.]